MFKTIDWSTWLSSSHEHDQRYERSDDRYKEHCIDPHVSFVVSTSSLGVESHSPAPQAPLNEPHQQGQGQSPHSEVAVLRRTVQRDRSFL